MISDTDVSYLSITAVSFSALCMLFGIYFTLFCLALWATYQKEGRAYKRLRIVTVVLFVDLTVHLTSQAVLFARSRVVPIAAGEDKIWTIPMTFIQGLTTTFAGLLSDGLLAWRFFVIFNRRSWALWIPTSLIIINTLLALSANLLPLTVYHNMQLYENELHKTSLVILAAWGWFMFGTHTLLTGSIIGRIICFTLPIKQFVKDLPPLPIQRVHKNVLKAIVESSLVTWIGLLMYEITSFAPTGHITTDLDVGSVMGCILPVFFGIAQCLITVRLGFADMNKHQQASTDAGRLAPTLHDKSGVAIQVDTEVHEDWSLKKDLERAQDQDTLSLSID